MATPCTNSLGGESGGQEHEGARRWLLMMMFITISARDSKARRGDGEYVRLDEEAG